MDSEQSSIIGLSAHSTLNYGLGDFPKANQELGWGTRNVIQILISDTFSAQIMVGISPVLNVQVAVVSTLIFVKFSTGSRIECPYWQYYYYGTCVGECPRDLPYVMDHSTCVKQCDVGQYVEASLFCTDVSHVTDVVPSLGTTFANGDVLQGPRECPEGTLYTGYSISPVHCIPVLHVWLTLGGMGLFLLGFLLCCAWFYRIDCGVCARLTSCCKHKVERREANSERTALVDNDRAGEETSSSYAV